MILFLSGLITIFPRWEVSNYLGSFPGRIDKIYIWREHKMKSTNDFSSIYPKLIVVVIFTLSFSATVLASSMSRESVDFSGNLIYSKENIEKSPEKYIELMKLELERGNLKMVGIIGRYLTGLVDVTGETLAMYSMYHASINEVEKAERDLGRSKSLSGNDKYVLCAEAMILQTKKRYKEAVNICLKAIALDKKFSYSRNILGTLYFDMDQYEKAVDSFRKAIALFPGFSLGYTNLGYAYLYSGNHGNALKAFKKAVHLNPNSYNARNGLAIVFEKTGKPSLSIEELKTIQKNKPGYIDDILHRIGTLQLLAGKYDDAFETGLKMKKQGKSGAYVILAESCLYNKKTEQALSFINQINENNSSASYLKGIYMMTEGRYEDALTLMEEALTKNQRRFEAYISKVVIKYYLGFEIDIKTELQYEGNEYDGRIIDFISGNISARKGDWTGAEKKWQSAQGMFKGFSILGVGHDALAAGLFSDELKHHCMGILFYFIGLQKNALSEFEAAININENSIFGNYFAALVYLKKGDTHQAEKYLISSIKKAPRFYTALYGIGELNVMKGRDNISAIYYERALAVKKDSLLMVKLGSVYERQKEYKKATQLAEEFILLFPKSYLGYNRLAWIYAVQDIHLDKALSYAKKANKLKPSHPGIIDTLGWVYYKKKQYGKASELLKMAVQAEPTNPLLNYHLGASYYAQGNNDMAKQYLRMALNISTSFDNEDDARWILNQIN